jgi:hypothetical protein
MMKPLLLCSAVCTVILFCASAGPQERAAAAKPLPLHQLLRSFAGKKCNAVVTDAGWRISFQKRDQRFIRFKFDMLGTDFVRLSGKDGVTIIPFSSIREISGDT